MPRPRKGKTGDPLKPRGVNRTGWIVGLLFLATLSLSAATQETGSPDIAVTDVEFEVIPPASGGPRAQLGENQAILGDTVRVRAVIRNEGEGLAKEFDVEFFFREFASKETDKIGTATVFGLNPGEEIKPAVSLETSVLAPGIYEIIVKADPEGRVGENSATLSNNEIVPPSQGEEAKRPSPYALTLLGSGATISAVTVTETSVIPMCRMGPLLPTLTAEFYNVGTVPLTRRDLRVDSFYRTDLGKPFADLGTNLRILLTNTDMQPGEYTQAFLYWDLSGLDQVFTERGLRRSNDVQLKFVITPIAEAGAPSSLPREFVMPAKRKLSHFYSPVDLWTFPYEPTCAAAPQGGAEAGGAVKVPPTIGPDNLIYHVLSTPVGDRLYTLKSNGEELWHKDFSATLTAVAIGRYDVTEETESTILYLGTSDGKLFALRNRQVQKNPVLYVVESVWEKTVGAVSARPTVAGDKSRVIVGAANGLFVFDESGNVKTQVTNKGAVSRTPLYVDATHEVWFASGNTVYKASEDGAIVCSHDAGSAVTTSLETNPDQTVVYFGTERGLLWAVDAAAPKGTECKEKRSLNLKSPVRGVSVVRENNSSKDSIYVTTDDGYVHRLRYQPPTLTEEDVLETDLRLGSIKTSPAVLMGGGEVRGVFVTSTYGELRGFSPGLDAVLEVKIWGESDVPFELNSASEQEMTPPVVNAGIETLLVGSADGFLYAFNVASFLKK